MADGDRVHRAPNQRRDEWHVTVARALGRATRMTALEIEMLGRTMMRVKDSFLPEVGPRRRPLPVLLKKLGEVVSRHADREFVTLQSDPIFWALIRQIHASQPIARPARPKRRVPKRLAKRAARAKAKPHVEEESESAVDASASAALDDVADALGLVGAEVAAVDSGEEPAGEGDEAGENGSSDASGNEEDAKEQPE